MRYALSLLKDDVVLSNAFAVAEVQRLANAGGGTAFFSATRNSYDCGRMSSKCWALDSINNDSMTSSWRRAKFRSRSSVRRSLIVF
jgi:hypothetical protein